jgi:hypothetical protein
LNVLKLLKDFPLLLIFDSSRLSIERLLHTPPAPLEKCNKGKIRVYASNAIA